MGFCSQFKALFKKNFIVWRRSLFGSLCELLFPVILILLFYIIKVTTTEETYSEKSYIGDCKYSYYFDGNDKTDASFSNSGAKWMGLCKGNPFTSCIEYGRPIFGIVTDDNTIYSQLEAALVGPISVTSNSPMQFSVERFGSSAEIEDYVRSADYDLFKPSLCAAIVIEGSANDYSIKLRFDDNYLSDSGGKKDQVPSTKKDSADPLNKKPVEDNHDQYHTSGFTYLQYLIIKVLGGNSINNLKIGIAPMKTPEYESTKFFDTAGSFIEILIFISYLVPIFKIVSMIVQDKELNTREGMKIMGLKDSAYWVSILVYYFIIFVILSILMTLVSALLIFNYTHFMLLFLFFLLYGLAIFGFGFFLSTIFHRARIASITAAMIYFCMFVIGSFIFNENVATNIGESVKCAISLLPTAISILGSSTITRFETAQMDLNFSTISEKTNNFRFSNALLMATVDFILYSILGLYLDNVIPMPNGARKPIFYFLYPSYWCSDKTIAVENMSSKNEDEILYPNQYFEKVGGDLSVQENLNECLKIRHLHKYFGTKCCVADFSVNMYKGQIFALLGPNGAGKTTTISMLSGLVLPSKGTATFSGVDIFNDMTKLRTMLGVCPQHDVLFELLTPKEHLEIFAAFKGKKSIEEEVQEILNDIELNDCMNQQTRNLSGGQKRKLSIGISFIGNSDIIFLDEPTSGIDISGRKKVWAMLRKYKQDKIIILTTHYMEEAEELGDRIGIMTHGTIKCVGTPLFLKTVYGAGYNLSIVTDDVSESQQLNVQEQITNCIKSQINDVTIKKRAGKEIVYSISKSQVKDLKNLLVSLDKNQKELKIQSYGMATNSLEDIFLQVAEGDEKADQHKKIELELPIVEQDETVFDASDLDKYSIANESENSFCYNFGIQFGAVFMKRLYIMMRAWGTLLIEILVPILLIAFGLLLTKISLFYDSDLRWFDLSIYNSAQSILVNTKDISHSSLVINQFTDNLDSGLELISKEIAFTNNDEDALKSMETNIFYMKMDNLYGSLLINKLDTGNKDYEYIVFANLNSQDASAAFMSYFGQALLRLAKNDNNYNIRFANDPLPLTVEGKAEEQAKNGEIVSSVVVVALSLIPSNIISFIVQERETNLKHQQVVTGISLVAYWASNGFIDIIKTIIPSSISIGLVYLFDVTLPLGWLLILLYTFSIIPFTYFMSFFFKKENSAQTAILMINLFVGVAATVIVSLLRGTESTRSMGKAIPWILDLIPSFALGNGLSNIFHKDVYAAQERIIAEDDISFSVAGANVLYLCVTIPVWLIFIALIELRCFDCFCKHCKSSRIVCTESIDQEDKLVIKEKEQCDNFNLNENPPSILVKHLRKVYNPSSNNPKTAVENVSFYINKGECLALLGTSGAGKTTMLKILTNDIDASHGEFYINGMDLTKNFSKIRKLIGYGPQYESAFMTLTVRENLEFYSKLKGIPVSISKKLIDKQIRDMDLTEYENIEVGNLSGGNKRKTTVAIALLGNPPIVLLDEPSTGVDPQAKRFMWKMIQRASTKNKNTTVIFTTHSMEEAENLSTKMAIINNGNFSCIGTAQEVKEAFGKGYEIQVSIPTPTVEEEVAYLRKYNISETANMTYEEVINFFVAVGKPELKEELKAKGTASHIMTELNNKKSASGKLVANYLIIQERGVEIGMKLAHEFTEARVPEHIGSFFKYRVDKMDETQTIGFVFELLQEIVEKYNITQYSASHTTLTQIFQSLARKEEYGFDNEKDAMIIKNPGTSPSIKSGKDVVLQINKDVRRTKE